MLSSGAAPTSLMVSLTAIGIGMSMICSTILFWMRSWGAATFSLMVSSTTVGTEMPKI